jgi:hypothetical protein
MKKTYRQWSQMFLLASTVVSASTVLTSLPAQAGPSFNVKSFGATGNGTTDDTAAILAALSAANAVPGSTLKFPLGNYLYSSELIANGIAIAGQNATLTATSGAFLELTGNNVSVQGMGFATRTPSPFGVIVQKAKGFSIVNNVFGTGIITDIQLVLHPTERLH